MKKLVSITAVILTALLFAAGASCRNFPVPPEATAAPTEAAPTAAPTEEPSPEPTEAPEEDAVRLFISGMSVEDKISQLVMFGYWGHEPSEEFLSFIGDFPAGNIILNGGNIDRGDGSGGFDTAKRGVELIESAVPCAVPRLFAADVEGGSVARFGWEPAIPSANSMGRKTAEEAFDIFSAVGEKLRSCGINVDLAPVFDIAEDPLSSFMGSRIISSDLSVVSEIGSAMIGGLHAGGCIACAKHFPGHGGTGEDSHSVTPTVKKSLEELMRYDIAAFSAAISSGVDCVMAAHILYPALDPDNVASMSPAILTGLLREELGFEGVILTDDMLMEGLASVCSPGEAAVRVILAGGDMLLCGADIGAQREIMEALYIAVSEGVITPERLDESVYRILSLKRAYGLWEP